MAEEQTLNNQPRSIEDLLRQPKDLGPAGQQQAGRILRSEQLRNRRQRADNLTGVRRQVKQPAIANFSPPVGPVSNNSFSPAQSSAPALDETAANEAQERNYAEQLRRQKNQAAQQNRPDAKQLELAAERNVSLETAKDAQSRDEKISAYLKNEIQSGKFRGFFIALIIALIKDILDLPIESLNAIPIIGTILAGVLGTIISGVCVVLLAEIMYMQENRFKRWFFKKYLRRRLTRVLMIIIIQFIPVLDGVVPEMVVGVIGVNFTAKRRCQKLQKELNDVQRATGGKS